MNDLAKKEENVPATMYQNAVHIGTEEMGQEDINTPMLKIIQPNTQGIEDKKEGYFYRSDTKEQLLSVEVNLVYVTTAEVDNYNKTAKEKVKIYFGFYAGTNEPFRIYFRGWALADHREFQTEIVSLKNRYKVPMLALTVLLKTIKQTGTVKETGKPYTTYRPLFMVIQKDGKPVIEMNPDRISFLVEATNRFKRIAGNQSPTDEIQNDIPDEAPTDADAKNGGMSAEEIAKDIPF